MLVNFLASFSYKSIFMRLISEKSLFMTLFSFNLILNKGEIMATLTLYCKDCNVTVSKLWDKSRSISKVMRHFSFLWEWNFPSDHDWKAKSFHSIAFWIYSIQLKLVFDKLNNFSIIKQKMFLRSSYYEVEIGLKSLLQLAICAWLAWRLIRQKRKLVQIQWDILKWKH